ncbi:hypothetical protein [Mucilaginibacter lappiensis]|uniref:Uncharacterized protein n=1 Tax=Mucilaginibacter lappiensis TaxID=354630 RepID=A0A841JIR2_9SPHI|nr:hypothetical protein [Mucilaginibacter lappiensis]MBB6127881.1 hypothetical protein [Mucilaginibacter lappiensis]
MKKVLLIASITIVLFTNKSNAQTVVSAGGVTIKLNTEQVSYLRKLNNSAINKALSGSINIKYNSTADVIISLLKNRKPVKDTATLIAKQSHK